MSIRAGTVRSKRATVRVSSKPSLLLLAALLGLLWQPLPAQAQSVLIGFAEDQSATLTPPTYAEEARLIGVRASDLFYATYASSIAVQLDEELQVELAVESLNTYLNGDRAISAQGRDETGSYSLTLTVGQQNLFGHLSGPDGIYQLYAVNRDGSFLGWLYRPRSLGQGTSSFQNDYVILETSADGQVDRPQPEIHSTLPLKNGATGSDSGSDSVAASVAEIDETNFRISQQFSRSSVIAGRNIEALITFENISDERHVGLAVEFFFMLENSRLVVAPDECTAQQSLSLQEVLYCDLGDFEPGESKSFIYVLATSEESKPMVVSTPIVGNLRIDSFVNVVDDVLLDSDGDGISDYNEGLSGTDPANPESVHHGNSVIDVMALYTPAAEAMYPNGVETRINQLISVANQIYADSGVGITLRPVYHGIVDYNDVDDMDTTLNHLIEKTDPAFAEVDSLRSAYGGDLVMLFRPLELDSSRCGLAPVGGFNTRGDFSAETEKDFAYSYVGIDCPVDIVVAHELGHNMGLTHSHLEDGTGGTFNFSTGYGVDSQFVTVMAYPAAFNTETRVAQFSSPDLDCLGFPCGVDATDDFGADAAQSLNIVRFQIANYFPSTIPELPQTPVAAISGADTGAAIAVGASRDRGLSFTNEIDPTDLVEINAELRVDTLHSGALGSIHVLLSFGSLGFLQLDSQGALVPWDGSVEGLIPVNESGLLGAREQVKILDNYQCDPSLVGQQILVYVAYRPADTGDIIYTVNPLILNVIESILPPPTDTSATPAVPDYEQPAQEVNQMDQVDGTA